MNFPSTDLPNLKDGEDSTAVRKTVNDLLDKINQLGNQVDTLTTQLAAFASPYASGIISSGSNANGSYIKFADGTMMQWGNYSASIVMVNAVATGFWGTTTVTFPVAFIAGTISAQAAMSVLAGNRIILSPPTNPVSTTLAQFYAIDNTSETNTVYVNWQAVGRWK